MAGHFRNGLGHSVQNGWHSLYPTNEEDWPKAERHFSSQPPWEAGFHRPVRFEGSVNNLEVYGEIPKEIDGTFYRVMPEPQFPSYTDKNVVSRASCLSWIRLFWCADKTQWFNGDGNISAFRISNGHVDFKQRYVRTEKFVREAEARRALLGQATRLHIPYVAPS